MASEEYQKAVEQVEQLTPDELFTLIKGQVDRLEFDAKFELLAELVEHLRKRSQPKKRRGIMQYQGFAKEVWKDVDVDAYIREGRASWSKEEQDS